MDLAAIEAQVAQGEGGALDRALTERHGARNPQVLCALHKLAARYWGDDPGRVAFHKTHAYVYALEGGMWDEADRLYADLARDGRI